MFCTNCGNKNSDGMKFCTNCGTRLESIPTGTSGMKTGSTMGKTSSTGAKKILPILAIGAAAVALVVLSAGIIGGALLYKNGTIFSKKESTETEGRTRRDRTSDSEILTSGTEGTEVAMETTNPKSSLPASRTITGAELILKEDIENLNGDDYTAPVINVSSDTNTSGTRNKNAKWDRTVFYTLEGHTTSSGYYDKNICTLKKMSLVNEESGNTVEYDVYVNPSTNVPNKIVAIEYLESGLSISEYYFDNNSKISFIFKYKADNYVSGYAIPSKKGDRYLFEKDCMVTWRTINDKGTTNRVIGQKEANRVKEQFGKKTIKLYDSMSDKNKAKYDKREKKMLNEAYNTLNAVLNYTPTAQIQGYVHDANGNVMKNAGVYLYTTDEEGLLYNTETDENGMYIINVPTTVYEYNIIVNTAGYENTYIRDIDVDENIIMASQDVAYMFTGEEEDATVEVKVGDALNYSSDGVNMMPLSGATVYVREGLGNKDGEVIQTTTCDANGLVTLNLEAGSYTLEVQAEGYVTTYHNIVANPVNGVCVYEVYTSPRMESGQYRIVLTWGATPADLDSHLFSIRDGGDSHVWYSNKYDQFNNNLDVDDTTSYGPETVTIYDFRTTDYYKYCVVDYTNNSNGYNNSTMMSYSGATVNVYSERGLVATFNVPTGREGVVWEVFEIRNGDICPIQRYYNTIEDNSWLAH